MTNCYYCQLIAGEVSAKKLYEDDKVFVVLHPKPTVDGHILLFPKVHYTILEEVPDLDVKHMFDIANKFSSVVFETMNVGGTNIIIRNGTAAGQLIPHVALHILPRKPDDGLKLDWKPKQLTPEQFAEAESKLKDECRTIGEFGVEVPKAKVQEEGKEPSDDNDSDEEEKENYLIKQLRRVP